jgi:hypothetical protein
MGISDQDMQTAVYPVDTFLKKVIQERKLAGSVSKDASKSDIIDRLLSTSSDGTEVFSDQEIAEELLSFFFAGHETTGNTFTSIIRRICEAPDVYEKLLSAVKDVDANSWDEIHACKYLDWTVKEGLRLDPTAAVLGRINLKPVTVMGYTFTKRVSITFVVLSRLCSCDTLIDRRNSRLTCSHSTETHATSPTHSHSTLTDGTTISHPKQAHTFPLETVQQYALVKKSRFWNLKSFFVDYCKSIRLSWFLGKTCRWCLRLRQV